MKVQFNCLAHKYFNRLQEYVKAAEGNKDGKGIPILSLSSIGSVEIRGGEATYLDVNVEVTSEHPINIRESLDGLSEVFQD